MVFTAQSQLDCTTDTHRHAQQQAVLHTIIYNNLSFPRLVFSVCIYLQQNLTLIDSYHLI